MRKLLYLIFLSFSACTALPKQELLALPKLCRDSWCYHEDKVEGWNVFFSEELYVSDKEHFAAVRNHLKNDLVKIKSIVPEDKVKRLQKIEIYISLRDPQNRYEFGVYHWSREALTERRQDPDKFQNIEIANSANYLKWTNSQPAAVLHELAHAYSARYLTAVVKGKLDSAYKEAMKKGLYDEVPYFDGEKTYKQRSYATKDRSEYFCESVEAYFWRNDYFPFTKQELQNHDPKMFSLIYDIWNEVLQ